jgi:hypothetical protein
MRSSIIFTRHQNYDDDTIQDAEMEGLRGTEEIRNAYKIL